MNTGKMRWARLAVGSSLELLEHRHLLSRLADLPDSLRPPAEVENEADASHEAAGTESSHQQDESASVESSAASQSSETALAPSTGQAPSGSSSSEDGYVASAAPATNGGSGANLATNGEDHGATTEGPAAVAVSPPEDSASGAGSSEPSSDSNTTVPVSGTITNDTTSARDDTGTSPSVTAPNVATPATSTVEDSATTDDRNVATSAAAVATLSGGTSVSSSSTAAVATSTRNPASTPLFNDNDGDSDLSTSATATTSAASAITLDEGPAGSESAPPDAIALGAGLDESEGAGTAGDGGAVAGAPAAQAKSGNPTAGNAINPERLLANSHAASSVPQFEGAGPGIEGEGTGTSSPAQTPGPAAPAEGLAEGGWDQVASFGADVLATCTPFGREAVEGAIDHLLEQLDDLQSELIELGDNTPVLATVVGVVATLGVAEAVRRHLRKPSSPANAWLGTEDALFFPGLPGRRQRLALEES